MSTHTKRTQSFPANSSRARARTAAYSPVTTAYRQSAEAFSGPGTAGPQVPTVAEALAGGAAGPDGGTGVGNMADVPGSFTDLDSSENSSPQSDSEPEGDCAGTNHAGTEAAPVLKVGCKAKHPTLGDVTILVLGGLGAKIEFFSNRAKMLKERQVLLTDLEPLPEDHVPGWATGCAEAGAMDDDDPLQERAAPRTKLLSVVGSGLGTTRAHILQLTPCAQDTRTSSTASSTADLEQPTLNQFSRSRVPKVKPTSNAVFAGCGIRKTKPPKGITVEHRLQQFPGETYCKSAGFLFCRCCKQQLSTLKQTLVIHTNSAKHKENKVKYLEERHEDDEVKQILSDYFNEHPNEAQASLSPDTLLYRWRVVEVAMEEGISLNKLDALRSLLEKGGESLTHSKHLVSFVPKITQHEKDITLGEIKGERGCMIYDGTTRLGEATAALWRQCNSMFILMQRLVVRRTPPPHAARRVRVQASRSRPVPEVAVDAVPMMGLAAA